MTAVQRPLDVPIDDHRAVLAAYPNLDKIWTLDWETLKDIEIVPGITMSADVWIVPHEWAGAGQRQTRGRRTIDFGQILPEEWVPTDIASEHAIRRTKRLAALLFTQSIMLATQMRGPTTPSTWVAMVQSILKATKVALGIPVLTPQTSACPDGCSIYRPLDPPTLKRIFKGDSNGLSSAIPRLNGLLRAGLFDDWPAADVQIERETKGPVWQPFSDSFVGLAGTAALWMAEELGPDILDGWENVRAMRTERIATTHPRKASAQRQEYADRWAAQMADRRVPIRYKFLVSVFREDEKQFGWLGSWKQVVPHTLDGLALLLQEAHAWIVSLACGPRSSELVSLPRDCLKATGSGPLLHGWTFKLTDSSEARDWPIPKAAVAAIRQQQRLADILDPGGDRLFVAFKLLDGRRAERDRTRFNAYAFANRTATLEGRRLSEFCDGNVHSHRFRKTVARLAALSLVGASEILFDVFGHRAPEMTLAYILSDPELQDEMRRIASEAATMIAADALAEIGGAGGPAAPAVRELVARYLASSAEVELGESSLMAVAQLLSQDGRAMLVKRNVLCTKTLNQAGPCNRRTGNPDIGNCQVSCLHRLELAAARQDHRQALMRALDSYETANGMMRPWWRGQIIGHLLPFPDLAADALTDARVQDALDGIDLAQIAELRTSEQQRPTQRSLFQ